MTAPSFYFFRSSLKQFARGARARVTNPLMAIAFIRRKRAKLLPNMLGDEPTLYARLVRSASPPITTTAPMIDHTQHHQNDGDAFLLFRLSLHTSIRLIASSVERMFEK